MLTTRPGNWWCGDLHPTRFTALSAAPVQWGFFDSSLFLGLSGANGGELLLRGLQPRLFGRRFAVYDQRSTERAGAASLEIINASAQVCIA